MVALEDRKGHWQAAIANLDGAVRHLDAIDKDLGGQRTLSFTLLQLALILHGVCNLCECDVDTDEKVRDLLRKKGEGGKHN